MTMTAKELYEIVKDVPEEIWPGHIFFNDYVWIESGSCDSVSDTVAEAAFVGAMTKHMIDKYGGFNWERDHPGFAISTRNKWWGFFDTQVEALAAACKEAK